jgi:hypothetical protein
VLPDQSREVTAIFKIFCIKICVNFGSVHLVEFYILTLYLQHVTVFKILLLGHSFMVPGLCTCGLELGTIWYGPSLMGVIHLLTGLILWFSVLEFSSNLIYFCCINKYFWVAKCETESIITILELWVCGYICSAWKQNHFTQSCLSEGSYVFCSFLLGLQLETLICGC